MNKNFKRLMIFFTTVFIVAFLFVNIIPVFGAEDAVDIVDKSQSWLAEQLETYGVPSAIAAVIASFGTGGAIWLLLRGFKKSKGQMIAALKAMGLSADTLNKVLDRLDQVEKRLEEVETITRENAEKTYTEKVIPLLDDVEKTLSEIHAMKDEIKNGTQKIIKSLTSEV